MTARHILTAKAAEREYFCFSDVDSAAWRDWAFTPEHVLRTYDAQYAGSWVIEPVDRCIVSLCRYAYPDRDRSIFVSLSAEGEVEFIGREEGFTEKIPEAGLDSDDAVGYGYMRTIRQIGAELVACGHSGQVYRRTGPNAWSHADSGLLQPLNSDDVRSVGDVNGPMADRLFAASSDGLFFSGGGPWRKLDVPTREWLHAIHVEDADTIWVCGRNGTLLKGNERTGFTDLSRVHDNDTFLSITMFDGKIYLGRAGGVSVFDGSTIEPVVTGLKPELRNGHLVDAVDGVLWSFGYDDIARFDGTEWRRYPTDKA